VLDILIPTYFRPHRIPILDKSLRENTRAPYRLVLMIEPQDVDSLAAAEKIDAKVIVGSFGSYENAMNTGYFLTDHPFFFLGVDDIEFTEDWDVVPLKLLQTRSELAVIGHRTMGKDCPPEGIYSCHFTVRRSFVRTSTLVAGMPNLVFYPYYHHECDRELFWYARNMGVYQSCPESVILNDQPQDATREKTTSKDGIDRHTYEQRRHLFRGA